MKWHRTPCSASSRNDTPTRTALAAVAAFAVGYLLPGALALPVLVYDPRSSAFRFTSTPAGMEMRYYGDLLHACCAALLGTALARIAPPCTPLAVPSATALSLVALDVLFYLSRLLAAR